MVKRDEVALDAISFLPTIFTKELIIVKLKPESIIKNYKSFF